MRFLATFIALSLLITATFAVPNDVALDPDVKQSKGCKKKRVDRDLACGCYLWSEDLIGSTRSVPRSEDLAYCRNTFGELKTLKKFCKKYKKGKKINLKKAVKKINKTIAKCTSFAGRAVFLG